MNKINGKYILERQLKPGLWEAILEVHSGHELRARGLRHRGHGIVSNDQTQYPGEKFRLIIMPS